MYTCIFYSKYQNLFTHTIFLFCIMCNTISIGKLTIKTYCSLLTLATSIGAARARTLQLFLFFTVPWVIFKNAVLSFLSLWRESTEKKETLWYKIESTTCYSIHIECEQLTEVVSHATLVYIYCKVPCIRPSPPMHDFDPKVGGGRLQGTTPLHGGSPSYIKR